MKSNWFLPSILLIALYMNIYLFTGLIVHTITAITGHLKFTVRGEEMLKLLLKGYIPYATRVPK